MAKQESIIFSHWHHLIEGLQESPKNFYTQLETALAKRVIPDISLGRKDFHEGGVITAKREYLRVGRKEHLFDICAAPFGNGFFISWWLGEVRPSWGLLLVILALVTLLLCGIIIKALGLILGPLALIVLLPLFFLVIGYIINSGATAVERSVLAIPLFGKLYNHIIHPNTYYREDTALMFQDSVHAAVLEVIDQITQAKGMRGLSELERKPIMKVLLQKR